MKILSYLFSIVLALLIAMVLLPGCEESTSAGHSPGLSDSNAVSSSGTFKLYGEMISIPSPAQLSAILEKEKIDYRADLLNPLNNRQKYVNEQKKAMNLGVYGADLAYIANYDKGQTNIDYFDAVGKLAADLQILENVDKGLVSRITKNISNRDSLLVLNARFFRAGDSYLKDAERNDLSVLVLFGGWVEAMYLSVNAAGDNLTIRNRIGEQQNAAKSLLNLFKKWNEPTIEPIKNEMGKVADIFSDMKTTYEYRKPIHDAQNKKSYFNSTSSVTVTDAQIAALTEHISLLRNLVIQ